VVGFGLSITSGNLSWKNLEGGGGHVVHGDYPVLSLKDVEDLRYST